MTSAPVFSARQLSCAQLELDERVVDNCDQACEYASVMASRSWAQSHNQVNGNIPLQSGLDSCLCYLGDLAAFCLNKHLPAQCRAELHS